MKGTSGCIITALNTWLPSPGQPVTHNGRSGLRVQTAVRRRTPDLFLPFSPAWQSFSYQSVISDELPGTGPRTEEVQEEGGSSPDMSRREGGGIVGGRLFGMGDLETAVQRDQTAIARYPP